MKTESIMVTANATALVDKNARRKLLILTNTSATTVYIGEDKNVQAGEGTPLIQNEKLEINATKMYRGPLFAVTSAGTADVRVLEW